MSVVTLTFLYKGTILSDLGTSYMVLSGLETSMKKGRGLVIAILYALPCFLLPAGVKSSTPETQQLDKCAFFLK